MRNTDITDSNYRRCKICGNLIRKDREILNGRLNVTMSEETVTEDTYDYPNGSGNRTTYIPVVNSGCWFCANSNPEMTKKV